jgi:hypothetical protein
MPIRPQLVRRAITRIVALVAVAAVALAGPAVRAEEKPDAAIVTPLVKLFDFGNQVGIPTGCNLASSLIGTSASELGVSEQSSELILAINAGCVSLVEGNAVYIAQLKEASKEASPINPIANPIIASTAESFVMTGEQFGTGLAPFGPTIAGMGPFIAFFGGTS